VGDALGLPTTTVGRALEDLAAHRVVERSHDGERTHRWRACDGARRLLGRSTDPLDDLDPEERF
jgi:DNA-binding IclR family transcriptional regulator